MIYLDPLAGHGMKYFDGTSRRNVRTAHMFSDHSRGETLDFGESIGMLPQWAHTSNNGLFHFDVMTGKYKKAVKAGAVEL